MRATNAFHLPRLPPPSAKERERYPGRRLARPVRVFGCGALPVCFALLAWIKLPSWGTRKLPGRCDENAEEYPGEHCHCRW